MIGNDFINASEMLRAGVYLLLDRGRVVFVGKAHGATIALIAAHRDLARKAPKPWCPIKGIVFDQVYIKAVHPDRLEATYASLIAEYDPRLNRPEPIINLIERRHATS